MAGGGDARHRRYGDAACLNGRGRDAGRVSDANDIIAR